MSFRAEFKLVAFIASIHARSGLIRLKDLKTRPIRPRPVEFFEYRIQAEDMEASGVAATRGITFVKRGPADTQERRVRETPSNRSRAAAGRD